jgi:hypothetical protein
MKRKFKQRCSSIPTISNNHLNSLNFFLTLTSNNILLEVMSSIIHIFNRPISVIVMRLIFETEYTPRAVVRLVNICIWLEGKNEQHEHHHKHGVNLGEPRCSRRVTAIVINLIKIRCIILNIFFEWGGGGGMYYYFTNCASEIRPDNW